MKILIVKTSSLGDIIHAFGALDYLRHRFPHATIDWVVERRCSELITSHPQIDRALIIESKQWGRIDTWKHMRTFRQQLREKEYDFLFDLQGNVKSGLIVAQARAQQKIGFGWKSAKEWPNAFFTHWKVDPPRAKNIREDYLAIVQHFFKDFRSYKPHSVLLKIDSQERHKLETLLQSSDPPTLVCPSSAWANKCLTEAQLVAVLKQLNHQPYWFLWGALHEKEVADRLAVQFPGSAVLEKLRLPVLQHLMSRSKLVIAMDSLPLHLCGTTTTPTLSFFGPSSAAKFAPLGEHHKVIQGECPYGVTFEKRCPKLRTCPTGLCLKLNESWRLTINAKKLSDFDDTSILPL